MSASAAGQLQIATDFEALPEDAARLLDETGQTDFQMGLPWLRNLVRTVDFEGAQPLLGIWRVQGHVAVLLPLLRQRVRWGCELRSLGNYYTTRWAPVAPAERPLDADTLADALRAALKQLGPVCRLRLQALHEAQARDLLRPALRRAGCAVFDDGGFANWVLPVTEPWSVYLAQRDGRLRTTLQRMGKRFSQQGGRIELLRGGPRLAEAVHAYDTVYAASWKGAEPHPRFMPGLIEAAAASGQLRMALAWLGERPVAAQVWLMSGRRAEIYKLAHDEACKACSPGTLLTAALMQQAFEADGVTMVDYLSGDDAYKRLWMSEPSRRLSLRAYLSRAPQGLLTLVSDAGRAALHR